MAPLRTIEWSAVGEGELVSEENSSGLGAMTAALLGW